MNAQSFENHYGDVFGGVVLGTEHVKVVSEHLHPSYIFTYPKVTMTELRFLKSIFRRNVLIYAL